MTMAMKIRDAYNEGMERGVHQSITDIVVHMLSLNKTPDDICLLTGQPKSVIDAIIDEIQKR